MPLASSLVFPIFLRVNLNFPLCVRNSLSDVSGKLLRTRKTTPEIPDRQLRERKRPPDASDKLLRTRNTLSDTFEKLLHAYNSLSKTFEKLLSFLCEFGLFFQKTLRNVFSSRVGRQKEYCGGRRVMVGPETPRTSECLCSVKPLILYHFANNSYIY